MASKSNRPTVIFTHRLLYSSFVAPPSHPWAYPWVDRGTCLLTFWSGGDNLCFVPPLLFGVVILNTCILITLYKGYCLAMISLVFVRRRTVFVRSVFFEDLTLTVTGFSDLRSALWKSTHAVISYLLSGGKWLAAPSKEPHPPLGPSSLDPVPLIFYADLRPCSHPLWILSVSLCHLGTLPSLVSCRKSNGADASIVQTQRLSTLSIEDL